LELAVQIGRAPEIGDELADLHPAGGAVINARIIQAAGHDARAFVVRADGVRVKIGVRKISGASFFHHFLCRKRAIICRRRSADDFAAPVSARRPKSKWSARWLFLPQKCCQQNAKQTGENDSFHLKIFNANSLSLRPRIFQPGFFPAVQDEIRRRHNEDRQHDGHRESADDGAGERRVGFAAGAEF
jgi:hypothetical protein